MNTYNFNSYALFQFLKTDIQAHQHYLHISIDNHAYILYIENESNQLITISKYSLLAVSKPELLAIHCGHRSQDEIELFTNSIEGNPIPSLKPISFNNLLKYVFQLRKDSLPYFNGHTFYSESHHCYFIPLFKEKRIVNFYQLKNSHVSSYNTNAGYQIVNSVDNEKIYLSSNPLDCDNRNNYFLILDFKALKEKLISYELEISENASQSTLYQYFQFLIYSKTQIQILSFQTDLRTASCFFLSDDPLATNKKINNLKKLFREAFNYSNDELDKELENTVSEFYLINSKREGSIFHLSLLLTFGNIYRFKSILSKKEKTIL